MSCTYDSGGNVARSAEQTILAAGSVTDASVVKRRFDANNRVVNFEFGPNGYPIMPGLPAAYYPGRFVTGYLHDENGNTTKIWYPNGNAVVYEYDSQDRIVKVTDWAGRVTQIAWDDAGRLRKVIRPNGTTRWVSYDLAGRLERIAERRGPDPLSPIICFLRFELDAAGRVQKRYVLPEAQGGMGAGFSLALLRPGQSRGCAP